MQIGLNKVMLIGNLGKDPEVSFTASGLQLAKFSVATSEKWKREGGEEQEKVTWHNIVAWRKLAEVVEKYLSKGSKVYVEGKLDVQTWEDKNTGKKRYATNIIAENIQFLSPKKGGEEKQTSEAGFGSADPEPQKTDLPF